MTLSRMDGASLQPTDDNDLIARVAQGDREALRVLYERHAPRVWRVARRYLGSDADASDVTQSVFAGLVEGARRFEPRARFSTWLYRVTANRCLNFRTSARERLDTGLDDVAEEALAAPSRDEPDAQVLSAERAALLADALGRLPERQRIAIVLSRFEDLSYDEIARALDCTVPTVESLLFRARRNLSKILLR